jgi:hypothetical protein
MVIVVVASLWRPRAAVGLVRFRFYDWLLHSFNSYSLSSPASVSPNGGHQPYAGIPAAADDSKNFEKEWWFRAFLAGFFWCGGPFIAVYSSNNAGKGTRTVVAAAAGADADADSDAGHAPANEQENRLVVAAHFST